MTDEPRIRLPSLLPVLMPMLTMFHQDWDAPTIDEFYRAIADLPERAVLIAMRNLIGVVKFMPYPVEIRDEVERVLRVERDRERSQRRQLPEHEETPDEREANLKLIRETVGRLWGAKRL